MTKVICYEKSNNGNTWARLLKRTGLIVICAFNGRTENAVLPWILLLGMSDEKWALGWSIKCNWIAFLYILINLFLKKSYILIGDEHHYLNQAHDFCVASLQRLHFLTTCQWRDGDKDPIPGEQPVCFQTPLPLKRDNCSQGRVTRNKSQVSGLCLSFHSLVCLVRGCISSLTLSWVREEMLCLKH